MKMEFNQILVVSLVSCVVVILTSTPTNAKDLDGSLSGDISEFTISPVDKLVYSTSSDSDYEEENAGDKNSRFCNKSTTFTLKTDCRRCELNAMVSCPSGLRQLTEGRGDADCNVAQKLDYVSVIYFAGCRHTCEKTVMVTFCCSGYWGLDCQECPGGAQLPCSGHGKCLDGLYGNGVCVCAAGFDGVACELCKSNLYGPLCNKECQCVNGICDRGINGTGKCDCHSGYRGTLCDEKIADCDSLSCPVNSRCVQSSAKIQCVCDVGYEQDFFKVSCQPINRCLANPSPCHPKSVCQPTGPAVFECSCMAGFEGDGFVCSVVDPCQNDFGGCPVDSTKCIFVGPGQRNCECLEGFENYVEGEGCQLIDACAANKSLCHENANCTTTGPWEVECICSAGYIGDGQNCYGNIYERIKSLHLSDPIFQNRFQYAVQLTSSVYTDSLTKHGPFTLFLTTDEGIRKSLTSREIQNMLADKEIGRQLIRQHLIAAQLTLADLTNTSAFYTLEGNTAELFYKKQDLRFRLHDYSLRATVLKGDLIAANGIIHIVDQLLDKPPVTVGNVKKSIAYILSSLPRYSRFYSLLKAVNLTQKLASDGYYTVFAPSSVSWSSLPQGTFDYFLSTEGKGKLIEILENHIVTGPFVLASDMINMPQITMMGGLANEISVTSVGQLQFNKAVSLTQADIPASNGYIHSIDGILLPESLLPILPHRCDINTFRTVRGTCGLCSGELKCPWISDVPLNDTTPGCRYWVNLSDGKVKNYVPFSGCHQMCNRTYTVVRCCDGFYGSSCHPCPGGFQKPCFGRGKCRDGYYGTGECICDPTYAGAGCEFCADKSKFGPFCNNTCTCLHGTCDNRISGSIGICKRSSCGANYTGENCDSQVQLCDKRLRLQCHAFADCVRQDLDAEILEMFFNLSKNNRRRNLGMGPFFQGKSGTKLPKLLKNFRKGATCRCRQGYQGSGTFCVEIDPCSQKDRGGCHTQADCIKTGPNQNLCRCTKGWVGDGFYCYPASGCQNNSHCHENAKCLMTLAGEYACTCSDGYHGNGTYCVANNICLEDNGGCHVNALCVATGPGLANCTCKGNFRGDGYDCYGSIGYEIQFEPQLQHLGKFFKKLKFTDDLDNLASNYTFLAPSEDALESFLNLTSAAFWNEELNLRSLLGFHLLPTVNSLDDLRSKCSRQQKVTSFSNDEKFELQCSVRDDSVFFNDAKVIFGDNPALNGFIHVIDKVLEPYFNSGENPGLAEVSKRFPAFSEFFMSLSETGMMEDIASLSSFTLFVSTNFERPASNLKNVLMYYVTPIKLSTWRLKLFNGQRLMTTLGNSVHQQLTVATVDNKVFINTHLIVEPSNVPVSNGFIHVINGTLKPILNRCDILSFDDQLEEICCPGYFGINCNECPGGANNFCSDHGTCRDGIEGDGMCVCNEGYDGDICNICVDETCRTEACEINNGGCHEFADCDIPEDGNVSCSCSVGYVGDGLACLSPCDDGSNGGCSDTAKCQLSAFGEILCQCSDGYEMVDDVCKYVANDCAIANGGCSSYGTCSQTQDIESVTCSCNEGFTGDGYVCLGDLWQALSELPEVSNFYKLVKSDLYLIDSIADRDSNWTVFIPSNTYLPSNFAMTELELQEYFVNDTTFYFDHSLLEGDIELLALNGETIHIFANSQVKNQASYFVNDVPVMRVNIRVTNGVLHILERPFTLTLSHQVPAANALLQDSKATNPWIVAFLLIFVASFVVFVVVIAFQKRRALILFVNQLLPARRFPFFQLADQDAAHSMNVVTFNPMVNYDQNETLDDCLHLGGIFLDFDQQESGSDRQHLI